MNSKVAKEWSVYCLKSQVSNRTYVGATTCYERRLDQHNGKLKGGAIYTQVGRPWKVILVVSGFKGRTPCLQFEYHWQKITEKFTIISQVEKRRETALDYLMAAFEPKYGKLKKHSKN